MTNPTKIIIVGGFGPGISNSLAKKWGKAGYAVALVSRTKSRVEEGAAALEKHGINAKGFAADLVDPEAVRKVIVDVRVGFPNAYGQSASLLDPTIFKLLGDNFAISVASLVVTVHAVLEDLEVTNGAVLVTGGAFSLDGPESAQAAVTFNASPLAITKSSQRKLVHLLNLTLAPKGVYAGEVTVAGMVKDKFAELERERKVVNVVFSGVVGQTMVEWGRLTLLERHLA